MMCLAVSMIPVGIIGGMEGLRYSSLLIILIFGVTFIVSLMISFFITKPIVRLTKNIDEISKGRLDVNLESSEIHEINNLTDSLNRVMTSLKLAIHKVGVKKGEIFDDATTNTSIEKRQSDLLDSIMGWAWEIDDKIVYTYCSKNISEALGYEPEEIIGKSFFDFMLQDDVKKAEQIFYEASDKNKPIKNFENWNLTKNGEKVCVITNGVPFFDEYGTLSGYRGVDINITNEKDAERKLKELNTKLSELKMEITDLLKERDKRKPRKLEKNSSNKIDLDEKWSEHEFDSVFMLDASANLLDCNENMYKRLGYTKSEMLSLNMADFDALESKKDIAGKINAAKKKGVISFKSIHKRKDGSAILVHENLQYIKDKNAFKCIVREDYSLKKSK